LRSNRFSYESSDSLALERYDETSLGISIHGQKCMEAQAAKGDPRLAALVVSQYGSAKWTGRNDRSRPAP